MVGSYKKAIIITIGDELITGYKLDRNSKWLSKELFSINIRVSSIISIGDNEEIIIQNLIKCSKLDIDYVFITGGLGPTNDDKTCNAIKSFLDTDSYNDIEYAKYLRKKLKIAKLDFNSLIEKQSKKIKGVKYYKNPIGTALPFSFLKNEIFFFIFPGVPSEFKSIYVESVVPLIDESRRNLTLTLNTSGISESKLYEKIHDLIDLFSKSIKVGFLPNFQGVKLRLMSISEHNNDLKNIKLKIISRIEKYYFGEGNIKLEKVVLDNLKNKKLTLSTAESCTGGSISKLITNLPGSSKVFKGSIVAYSNDVKKEVLKISKKRLEKYGAVSKEISEDMCVNISKIMSTDVSISTTGISGPDGGSKDKPVGIVFISIKYLSKIYTKKINLIPDRNIHRLMASQISLNMLRLIMNKEYGNSNKKN